MLGRFIAQYDAVYLLRVRLSMDIRQDWNYLMTTSARKFNAYLILGLAGFLGGGSLLAFMFFLFAGPVNLVNMELGETATLLLDVFLCLSFFAQHSTMIRGSFRRRLVRFLPVEYHGALYAIASGVVLSALVVFWQESADTLTAPKGIVRWLLRVVYFLSFAGVAWGMQALGSFDPFGFKPVLNRLRGVESRPSPFIVRGPYRWVRHPLYFFLLLMIWSCPDLTVDRLLFNVLFTGWMVIGSILEERDLVDTFGELYREYQRKVPMLIPCHIRPIR
jgi:protein-S-isoprenylcysteine O-methyltransferase Ste14